MSKDFEKEYRELAQSEIPDLWNRIEAGLTEKSAPEKEAAAEEVIERETIENEETEKETAQKEGLKRKRNNRIYRYLKRYSAAAAAVLCAALIIPAMFLISRFGGKSSSSDMSAGESAAEAVFDSAEGTEAAEEWEGIAEEAPAKEPDVAEAMPDVVLAEEAADETEIESRADESQGTAGSEAAFEEKKEAAKDFGNERNNDVMLSDMVQTMELTDGTVLKNVILEVTEEEDDVYEEEGSKVYGTLYTVSIQKEPSGTLKEGGQMVIYAPIYSSIALCRDAVYEVDIVYKSSEKYPFWLEGYHQKAEQ